MTPPDWDLSLQRFVTGEMPDADERAFLAGCEASPDRWRRVALELVEWRTMGRLLGEGATRGVDRAQPTPAPRRQPAWPMLAVAASLLFLTGAACTWLLSSRLGLTRPGQGVTAEAPPQAGGD